MREECQKRDEAAMPERGCDFTFVASTHFRPLFSTALNQEECLLAKCIQPRVLKEASRSYESCH